MEQIWANKWIAQSKKNTIEFTELIQYGPMQHETT